MCSVPNCGTAAAARSLCKKHGGKTAAVCTYEGCSTNAMIRGLCFKHGANGICKTPECKANVRF